MRLVDGARKGHTHWELPSAPAKGEFSFLGLQDDSRQGHLLRLPIERVGTHQQAPVRRHPLEDEPCPVTQPPAGLDVPHQHQRNARLEADAVAGQSGRVEIVHVLDGESTTILEIINLDKSFLHNVTYNQENHLNKL